MLNVYMTGLIYFNGCNEPVRRAYAPDGTNYNPRHYASLWIAEADIVSDDWWSGPTERISRNLEGLAVIEFRIPSRATLTFPESASAGCSGLDKGLAKLKKKQGSGEVDFQVNPVTAETIADVTMIGGAIMPRLYRSIRLAEWKIGSSADVQITAVTAGGSRSITVRDDAEVVFTNIPEVPDHGPGDHVILFNRLNPTQPGELIAKNPTGQANPITQHDAILEFVRFGVKGNTPGCCLG